MPSFKETIEATFEKSLLTGKKVKTVYGRSSSGQQFACFVSSGVWYAVRLVVEEEYQHFKPTLYSNQQLELTQHLTLEGAEAKIAEYQTQLGDIEANRDAFYEAHLQGKAWCMSKPLPGDWGAAFRCGSGDYKYLERGDIVQGDSHSGSHHVGVYLGDGKVAHMAAGKARIGNLIPAFVPDEYHKLQVVVLWVRVRSKEAIASTAEMYVKMDARAGANNCVFRNCHHFVTQCALGLERNSELFLMESVLK